MQFNERDIKMSTIRTTLTSLEAGSWRLAAAANTKIARQWASDNTFGPSQKAKCPFDKNRKKKWRQQLEAAECLKSNKLCVRASRQMATEINSREKSGKQSNRNAIMLLLVDEWGFSLLFASRDSEKPMKKLSFHIAKNTAKHITTMFRLDCWQKGNFVLVACTNVHVCCRRIGWGERKDGDQSRSRARGVKMAKQRAIQYLPSKNFSSFRRFYESEACRVCVRLAIPP